MSNQIEGMMQKTIEQIRQMADSNTVVGSPITCGDTVIIPISKISYGFASGGSDLPTKTQKDLFGGGAGAGITVEPIAFITIHNGSTTLLQIDPMHSSIDRIANSLPNLIDKAGEVLEKVKNMKKEKSELVEKSPIPQEPAPDPV